jgi:hypothetical protein
MLLALLGSLALLAHGSPSSAPRWCSSVDEAEWVGEKMKRALEGSDVERERLYGLPRLPPDSVLVVRDEHVCERAARAYYRRELGPFPASGIAVVRVGNRYAVQGTIRAGEWTILVIFSAEFEPIASVAT